MIKDHGCCPHCNSNEVFTNAKHSDLGDRKTYCAGTSTQFTVVAYACFNCGYMEEFIDDADLKNEKLMEDAKVCWQRVKE